MDKDTAETVLGEVIDALNDLLPVGADEFLGDELYEKVKQVLKGL